MALTTRVCLALSGGPQQLGHSTDHSDARLPDTIGNHPQHRCGPSDERLCSTGPGIPATHPETAPPNICGERWGGREGWGAEYPRPCSPKIASASHEAFGQGILSHCDVLCSAPPRITGRRSACDAAPRAGPRRTFHSEYRPDTARGGRVFRWAAAQKRSPVHVSRALSTRDVAVSSAASAARALAPADRTAGVPDSGCSAARWQALHCPVQSPAGHGPPLPSRTMMTHASSVAGAPLAPHCGC